MECSIHASTRFWPYVLPKGLEALLINLWVLTWCSSFRSNWFVSLVDITMEQPSRTSFWWTSVTCLGILIVAPLRVKWSCSSRWRCCWCAKDFPLLIRGGSHWEWLLQALTISPLWHLCHLTPLDLTHTIISSIWGSFELKEEPKHFWFIDPSRPFPLTNLDLEAWN